MSKIPMTQLEVVAALMNDCHIVWVQLSTPGCPRFNVRSFGGERVGRIAPATVESLWAAGFLKVYGKPHVDGSGNTISTVVLATPKMPFFRLDGGDQDA